MAEGKGAKKAFKLTEKVKASGCAAKFPAAELEKVLKKIPVMKDSRLVAGFGGAEDAFVYDMGGSMVMVETVDFFPPMVDDPFVFGEIAAANAISDIYAMGAQPAVAMSLLCFPSCLGSKCMEMMLKGGASKAAEAGIAIAGGHTIADEVPKFGLSVTGFCCAEKIWRNNTPGVGDVLVLTKPLGAGIAMTAAKAGVASKELEERVVESMRTLNMRARDIAVGLTVSACTDVTGFGLIGHLHEMTGRGEVVAEIDSAVVPVFDGIFDLAKMGLIPEGMYDNVDYVGASVEFADGVGQEVKDVLFGPETSGGLLLSMPEKDAGAFVADFPDARAIGRMTARKGEGPSIRVR